jgi:hypothetical protein
MKIILLISLVLTAQAFGYVDMTDVVDRASDLRMRTKDYTFAMAIAGTFSGSIFGLFLWKSL